MHTKALHFINPFQVHLYAKCTEIYFAQQILNIFLHISKYISVCLVY